MKKIIGLILVFFMILINMYIGFNIVYALGVSSEIKNNGFVRLLEDKEYPNKLEVLEEIFKQEDNSMLKHVMAMTLYNFLKTLIKESTFDTNAKEIIEKWENKKDKTKLINGIIRIIINCFENTDLLNILKQDEVMELLNKLIDKKDEDFEKETIDLIKECENKNKNYKVCIFRLFNKQIINKQNKINKDKDKDKDKEIDKEIDKFLSDDTLILNIIYDFNFENDIDTILQDKLTERKEKVENKYKDIIKELCPIVQNFTDNGKQEFLNKKENELVASLLSNDKDVKQNAMKEIAKIILSIKDNTIKQNILDGTIVIELKKQIIDQINNNNLRDKEFLKFIEKFGDIVFEDRKIFDQIINRTDEYTWRNEAFLEFIKNFKDILTDEEIFKLIIDKTDAYTWRNEAFLKFIKNFKDIFTDKEIFKLIIGKTDKYTWRDKAFLEFIKNFKDILTDEEIFKLIIGKTDKYTWRDKAFLEFIKNFKDIPTDEEIFKLIIGKTDEYAWRDKAFLKFIAKFNGKTIFTDKEILKKIIGKTDEYTWKNKAFLEFIKNFKDILTDEEIFKLIIGKTDGDTWRNENFLKFIKTNFKEFLNDETILNEIKIKINNNHNFNKFKAYINRQNTYNLATGITRFENNIVYVKNPYDNDKEIFITYTIEETNLSFEKLVSITKTKIISDNELNKTVLAELAVLEWANKNKYADNSWTRELGYQESIKNNWKNLNEKTKEILITDLNNAVNNDPVINVLDVVFDNIGTKKENTIIEKLFNDVKTLLNNSNQDLILEINKEKISIKEVKELLDRKETWNKQDKEKIKHIFKLFSKIGLQTAINSMPEELNISINDTYVEELSKIDVFANIGRAIRSAA